MNKKTMGWNIFYLLASLLVTATVTSCSLSKTLSEIWTEDREWETTIRDERYTIDPSTLLETIKEEKSNSFTLLKATPPVYPARSTTPITWKQADYLFVAKAFHQFVWQEPFPEGELIDIKFYLYCEEIGFGPQSAKYKLIHITRNKEDETRIDRTIIINPAYIEALAWESSYNPNYSQYKFIDLSKIRIPIETALSIAEKNGGQKFRLKHKDKCAISAELNPNGHNDGWVIEYDPFSDSENEKEKFEIQISMMTGEYKELR